MAKETHDQPIRDPVGDLAELEGASDAVEDGAEFDAALSMGLRIEENLDVHDAVGMRPLDVGPGEIEEVLFSDENRGPRVVQIKERLKIREVIGGAHFVDVRIRQRHPIALGERKQHLWFEGALDMHVEFGLGQGDHEVAKIAHDFSIPYVSASANDKVCGIAEPRVGPQLIAVLHREAGQRGLDSIEDRGGGRLHEQGPFPAKEVLLQHALDVAVVGADGEEAHPLLDEVVGREHDLELLPLKVHVHEVDGR